jgi:hypothetical protein
MSEHETDARAMENHHPTYHDPQLKFIDITAPEFPVDVVVRADGKVLWINIGEVCIMRICQMKEIIITDDRPM